MLIASTHHPSHLGDLKQQYLEALLQENHRLLAACAEAASALADAYGGLAPSSPTGENESPTPAFIAARDQAEMVNQVRYSKFFAK